MIETEKIRILMADDHETFRQGLRSMLESNDDFVVVGEAVNGAEAIALTRKTMPDVILLDVSMPDLSGFEVLHAISAMHVRPIMLTAGMTKTDFVKSLQLGARGVVWKDAGPEILFKSIRCVMNEQYWISRETVGYLVETLRTISAQSRNGADIAAAEPMAKETNTVVPPKSPSSKPADKAGRAPVAAVAPRKFGLTARELEIVNAIVDGQGNRDIAVTYGISEYTVKHHLTRIFDKVGVFSRLELAMFAIHHEVGGGAREPTSKS